MNRKAGKTNEIIIRFVGKRRDLDKKTGKTRLVPAEAPRVRINGRRGVIELPPDDAQKKGFTHPDAEFLLKTYPREFKRKVSKGKIK